MHDTVQLEASGVPAVMVASSELSTAAAAQASALGADPACVFVPHPIQDRTDVEIQQMADAATDELIAAITEG